jgi:hypothetical protein
MHEAWEGFSERIKKLAPIWNIGKGMRLSTDLEKHKENIVLAILIYVFEKELNDDEKRKRTDIVLIAKDVLIEMKLPATDEAAERIAAGLLWSGSQELQNPFTLEYFDPITKDFVQSEYRYLEDDELYSGWKVGGNTVYKLTEIAQNIIFMSREIMQELSIELEQLYGLQLIKRGKFNKALSSVRDLNRKVKTLINKEESIKREIQNNPKILLQEEFITRLDRDKEIQEQFSEEKKRFDTINRQLYKAKDIPEYKDSLKDIENLHREYEVSRSLHDKLARLYVETFEVQLRIRTEHPEIFWSVSQTSFRKDIWEDIIVEEGITNPEAIDFILAPLFTPVNEFIFPLDWAWQEHDFIVVVDEEKEEDGEEDEDGGMLVAPHRTNWEKLVDIWAPIFDVLIEDKHYDLRELDNCSEDMRESWIEQKEAIDMWLVFSSQPIEVESVLPHKDYSEQDERLVLIQMLIERNEKYKQLIGKTIKSVPLKGDWMKWNKVRISPYRLLLED